MLIRCSLHFLGLIDIKVAISEFGLSMLMPILLNHYIFIEVKGTCMITSGLKANKMHFKTQSLFTNKAKRAFLITLCYIVLLFMM